MSLRAYRRPRHGLSATDPRGSRGRRLSAGVRGTPRGVCAIFACRSADFLTCVLQPRRGQSFRNSDAFIPGNYKTEVNRLSSSRFLLILVQSQICRSYRATGHCEYEGNCQVRPVCERSRCNLSCKSDLMLAHSLRTAWRSCDRATSASSTRRRQVFVFHELQPDNRCCCHRAALQELPRRRHLPLRLALQVHPYVFAS